MKTQFLLVHHILVMIKNNKLRIYPSPEDFGVDPFRIWFNFYVKEDSTDDSAGYDDGTLGVNNMNTLPYENLPYRNINSMGKQWIRKYCLALCKEMLGQIRGKLQLFLFRRICYSQSFRTVITSKSRTGST